MTSPMKDWLIPSGKGNESFSCKIWSKLMLKSFRIFAEIDNRLNIGFRVFDTFLQILIMSLGWIGVVSLGWNSVRSSSHMMKYWDSLESSDESTSRIRRGLWGGVGGGVRGSGSGFGMGWDWLGGGEVWE